MTADLIARLSKLDGPCRQMDRDIDAFIWFGHHGSLDRTAPTFTSSVDAAIALAERVLPGNAIDIKIMAGKGLVSITYGASSYVGSAENPAIALCIAILRAKEANHDE